MTDTVDFLPQWASPPGATILDLLEERNLSRAELALQLNKANSYVDRLVSGQIQIDARIARGLEAALGASASFWLKREAQYRIDLQRLESGDLTMSVSEWVRRLPTADMQRFGWIPSRISSLDQLAAACLDFFGVPDLKTWISRYANGSALAAFRASPTFAAQTESVAAWLRQGELVADRTSTHLWNAPRFQEALLKARSLTRLHDPGQFIPELTTLCADCGVVVAIIRSPKGCPASGAARFVSPQKALLQLSFRYLSDDHFWFTFFHEAGHLLLHGVTKLHLEGVDASSEIEEGEANEFAANILIPATARTAMHALPLDGREVIRFATKLGISPGIVVGQLQHDGVITRQQLNNLKRRFSWRD